LKDWDELLEHSLQSLVSRKQAQHRQMLAKVFISWAVARSPVREQTLHSDAPGDL